MASKRRGEKYFRKKSPKKNRQKKEEKLYGHSFFSPKKKVPPPKKNKTKARHVTTMTTTMQTTNAFCCKTTPQKAAATRGGGRVQQKKKKKKPLLASSSSIFFRSGGGSHHRRDIIGKGKNWTPKRSGGCPCKQQLSSCVVVAGAFPSRDALDVGGDDGTKMAAMHATRKSDRRGEAMTPKSSGGGGAGGGAMSASMMAKERKKKENAEEGRSKKAKDASSSSSSSLQNKSASDDECERTPANAKWKRVMLKISGEALSGTLEKQNFGLDPSVVERIAGEIVAASMSGVEIAVVVGGGNFFRGASHEGAHLDRASADYMGMLATVMNAISLQGAIEAKGVQTRVLSALSIKEVAEPYIRRRAIRHLEKGRVVIFGAGTGNPFFTTDTGAALRAAEINAQVVLKATKVDGVFCSDPKQNINAKKYERLSYETVQRLGLGVMDQTAITMCRENELPIVVFDMMKNGNIQKAIRGQAGVGTCISDSDEKCP